MYLNMFQENQLFHQIALRTDVKPAAVAASVRQIVRQVLPAIRVARIRSLSDQVDAAIVPNRLFATLSLCFGLLRAILAGIGRIVGIYGRAPNG
jgi:hypothetical protein